MKKGYTTEEDILRSLVLYWLFKNANTLDAYALAEQMGLTEDEQDLKSWLERGCKVHWAWIEENGDLSHVLMAQQAFGSLQDRDLHAKIKPARIASSQRWSNDWKKLLAKINTAKSLSMAKPSEKEMELSWSAAVATCASLLLKVGLTGESERLLQLSRTP